MVESGKNPVHIEASLPMLGSSAPSSSQRSPAGATGSRSGDVDCMLTWGLMPIACGALACIGCGGRELWLLVLMLPGDRQTDLASDRLIWHQCWMPNFVLVSVLILPERRPSFVCTHNAIDEQCAICCGAALKWSGVFGSGCESTGCHCFPVFDTGLQVCCRPWHLLDLCKLTIHGRLTGSAFMFAVHMVQVTAEPLLELSVAVVVPVRNCLYGGQDLQPCRSRAPFLALMLHCFGTMSSAPACCLTGSDCGRSRKNWWRRQ